MKILIVGGGGREHALAWKLNQEDAVSKIFTAPGNGGTEKIGENVPISGNDIESLSNFAKSENIDLTIVGPEAPLTLGIVDTFNELGLTIFGPNKAAAQIEGSKSFSKNLMKKYNIPTADFEEFTNPVKAKEFVKKIGAPVVVKADGLAGGKGVIISKNIVDAHTAIDRIMVNKEFGDAGDKVIIEQFLTGEEASFLAFTDGEEVIPMASSQDHKPIYNYDEGPNTGGMGAYSPAPVVTDELFDRIMTEVMIPTVKGMKAEGTRYTGVLYAGVMIKDGELKVLEFNARFGDPEAQPLFHRLKSDLSPVLLATINGTLKGVTLEWDERPSICVVMASGGYPGKYQIGKEIFGVDTIHEMKDVVVFHAGTTYIGRHLNANGGRVLGVTAMGTDLQDAKNRAYKAVDKIDFHQAHFRTDIGDKGLKYV
jgi:phosphoribosylamine---glycine ligase